jgi:hypothetical protein
MKKTILGFIAIIAMVLVTWSCGGAATDTPTSVAEAAFKCIQEKDYKGYVDLMYFDESKGQDVEETKKQYEALLADKMDKLIEKRKGIESWEVISEEIAEDGMTAKVTTKIVYADGTTNEDKTKMIKTEDGKWLIDSNK